MPARITLNRSGTLYQLDDAGRPAWIFPVCAVDPESPEAIEAPDPLHVVSTGAVVDLLAFHPDAPGRWALRLGNAAVLGAIEPQCFDPDRVAVHRDIMGWLRSGCGGIVFLTAAPHAARRILWQCRKISADNAAHEAELHRLLTMPPLGVPAITIRAPT